MKIEPTVEQLLSCCASTRWAEQMAQESPFPDLAALLVRGEAVWSSLGPDDWREAFAAHPRIGDRPVAGTQESREQSSMDAADDAVRAAIARGNSDYEARFSMTYLVRAAGRSPAELLALLEERLGHDPEVELSIAAAQQWEITALRLTALEAV